MLSRMCDVQPVHFTSAAIAVATGVIIKFFLPCPAQLTAQAWSLLSIFVTTIVGAWPAAIA